MKILTLFLIILIIRTIQEEKGWSCTTDYNSDVKWPNTTNWTLSIPPCVNQVKELVYRKCTKGKWEHKPDCEYIQRKSSPQCSENFINSEELTICYQISIPSKFSIWLLQKDDNRTNKICFSWQYNNATRYFWKNNSEDEIQAPFLLCKFHSISYFALTISEPYTNEHNVTDILVDILESNSPASKTISSLNKVSKRYNEFTSTDVYLVSKILNKINGKKKMNLETLAAVVSNLQRIEKKVLRESQMQKSATDSILSSIDEIITNQYHHQSFVEIKGDNFIIVIFNVGQTNFSGLLLLKRNLTIQTKFLEGDHNTEEVAALGNLDSAVVLSPELKNQLLQNGKVIITTYFTDAFFNAQKPKVLNAGKIFGVILPPLESYSGPVSVLQKISKTPYRKRCVHWYYKTTVKGSWVQKKSGRNVYSMVKCDFWHTTHFGLLLMDQQIYDDLVDWITDINCSLSLFGLFSIVVTAILFRTWRRNSGNIILLNFAIAMITRIEVTYLSSTRELDKGNYFYCSLIGAAIHYCILAEIFWMLIVAFLQYRRYVKIFGGPPTRILLKSCLFGWVLPLVPVILVFALDEDSYIKNSLGICYPSGPPLYLGLYLPVLIVIFTNLIIFILIIYNVVDNKTELSTVGKKEAIFQWRLAVLLFFMLGFTYIFGILAEMEIHWIFIYIFAILGPLPGFVVFLFFIVLNANTRLLYTRAWKNCCHKDSNQ